MISVKALRTAAKAQGLNQSGLARLAGVSRQAVSLWFHNDEGAADIRASHLLPLCRKLRVTLEDLASPPPDLKENRAAAETALLWDGLYPDLESFAVAVCRREARALARLVESYGLYAAAKAAGPAVWTRFEAYARFLPPGRREELRRVWENRKEQKDPA